MKIDFDSTLHTKVKQHSTGITYVVMIKDFYDAKDDEMIQVAVLNLGGEVIFQNVSEAMIIKGDLKILWANERE